jgi:hypothetical protein
MNSSLRANRVSFSFLLCLALGTVGALAGCADEANDGGPLASSQAPVAPTGPGTSEQPPKDNPGPEALPTAPTGNGDGKGNGKGDGKGNGKGDGNSAAPSSAPRPVGAACAFGSQCESGGCSADSASASCGQCFDMKKLGEACGGPLESCGSTAFCGKGSCQSTHKVLGDACALQPKGGDVGECDDSLYCAGNPGDPSGICATPVPLGGACVAGYGEVLCTRGAACEDSICVPYHQGALGESCEWHGCVGGLHCDPATRICGEGTLPKGAPCGVFKGTIVDNTCAPGTLCGNLDWPNGGGGEDAIWTCVAPPVEGAPCISGGCADGLFCRWLETKEIGDPVNRCERPREVGEACVLDGYLETRCAAGLECRGGACAVPCK